MINERTEATDGVLHGYDFHQYKIFMGTTKVVRKTFLTYNLIVEFAISHPDQDIWM